MSKRGLPDSMRMRHDAHYVETLAAPSGTPVGRMVPIESVDPNPDQPRQAMGDLSELISSVAEKGIIEPLVVRQKGSRYQIVAGERRYHAAVQSGLTELPVVVRDVDDTEMLELALVENIQRKDLTPFEEAEALQQHFEKLAKKRARLDRLLETVEKTIASKKGGFSMQDKEKFAGFKEALIAENEQKYGKEIRDKYGDKAMDAGNAKLRGMTETEFDRMKDLSQDILDTLAKLTATGDPASEAAQKLAAKHKTWLMYSWKSYSKEAHAGLAEMYVADARFAAYYDKAAEGAATFLRDAILIFTDAK